MLKVSRLVVTFTEVDLTLSIYRTEGFETTPVYCQEAELLYPAIATEAISGNKGAAA